MEYTVKAIPAEREFIITGDFTAKDQETFFDIFLQIRRQTEPQTVFNLKACGFMDSAAMGMLVVACEEAAKRHLIRVIRGASANIKELLLSAQFDRLYVFQDEESRIE